MSTVNVKGVELSYASLEDMILVNVMNKKISIPIEKVSRDINEKKLSVKMLKEYLEGSKLVRRTLKE
jgi:hypothetical protein